MVGRMSTPGAMLSRVCRSLKFRTGIVIVPSMSKMTPLISVISLLLQLSHLGAVAVVAVVVVVVAGLEMILVLEAWTTR